MPPSTLKQLKKSVHERRSVGKKSAPQKTRTNTETSQQRANRVRQENLLPALHRRNKAGGIVDRRLGEGDPTLAPEERAIRRYAAQSQKAKRSNIFNLEDIDDAGEEELLTHGGVPISQSLEYNRLLRDDYEDDDQDLVSDDGEAMLAKAALQANGGARGPSESSDGEDYEDGPPRKKTRKEVMQEVVAKSKLYKHERQQAKEDDDTVRLKLDEALPDLLSAIRGGTKSNSTKDSAKQDSQSHAEHAPLRLDSQYDLSLREMISDRKAQPVNRTKTEQEKAQEQAEHLQRLEEDRQRRMAGMDVEDGEMAPLGDDIDSQPGFEQNPVSEAHEFGFEQRNPRQKLPQFDDEDEFEIEDDLVASDSEIDQELLSSVGSEDDNEEISYNNVRNSSVKNDRDIDAYEDLEFPSDVLPTRMPANTDTVSESAEDIHQTLPYTYKCPQSHSELLRVLEAVSFSETPKVVQRIRALYHPSLRPENKDLLSNFSASLVEHVRYMSLKNAPLSAIEFVIRHIHSLSRTCVVAVSNTFRSILSNMAHQNSMDRGDLAILTAIGSIFPTSDHFHAVATPAFTVLERWLGLNTPASRSNSLIGCYLIGLGLKYQQLSKRYMPEAINFTILALKSQATILDSGLLERHVVNLIRLCELYENSPAFVDIFHPRATSALASLALVEPEMGSAALEDLKYLIEKANLARRPLELHHHRPLPIKTRVPRFEATESFHPGKYYDPDPERAESARLRKEYKKEKRGAIRELRKDAEFMAREKLREKRERDSAHKEKERRLIESIQQEEGREKNEYEREKRKRKGKF